MIRNAINAPDAPAPGGGYSQAVRLDDVYTLLFVSGQIPVAADGAVPADFAGQCRQVWHNIEAQLGASGMHLGDIVKVTTYLSDRAFAEENSAIRNERLGTLNPALTVIIAEIFDPAWLLEIEVIAAKGGSA